MRLSLAVTIPNLYDDAWKTNVLSTRSSLSLFADYWGGAKYWGGQWPPWLPWFLLHCNYYCPVSCQLPDQQVKWLLVIEGTYSSTFISPKAHHAPESFLIYMMMLFWNQSGTNPHPQSHALTLLVLWLHHPLARPIKSHAFVNMCRDLSHRAKNASSTI